MTTVLWVNKKTNIVDNVSLDDRPISEITLPDTHFALDNDTSISVINGQEITGQGGIGFTWDGSKLIEPQPLI